MKTFPTFGTATPEVCVDCDQPIEKHCVLLPDHLGQTWKLIPHDCPGIEQREARLIREAQEQSNRLHQSRLYPSEDQILKIKTQARLPYWTPPGIHQLRTSELAVKQAEKVASHRDTWKTGKRPEKGLWLWGPSNSRKTCSLCALLFDIANWTNRPALYWTYASLLKHYRLSVSGAASDYDQGRIARSEALLLDDLSSVKYTEKAWEMLFSLVDEAYDGSPKGPTQTLYLTSNEGPSQLGKLIDAIVPGGGERIIRRLVQMTEVIRVGE